MKRKEDLAKMKVLEERRMQRERNEMKREAEQERRKLEKMQKEHEVCAQRRVYVTVLSVMKALRF